MIYTEIKRAVIEIEGGCNYNCLICPQSKGRGSFDARINFEIYKRLIDECKEMGLEVIQLDGSGEATLNNNLPEYIRYAAERNIKVQIYSNGFKMNGFFMEECIDSGLSLFRFSVNGYDTQTYYNMTGMNNFNLILENAIKMKEYIDSTKSKCVVSSYHLILEHESEVEIYRRNFIDKVGCEAEIWKMHNWSGMLNINTRKGKKRTCGRPFAPEITIRAGGINNHSLAVTPCCQTLGRDEEAVLAHCDNMSVKDAFNSDRYNWLRDMHEQKRFNEIPFCKNCDFLYDDPSVLVWSNKGSKINKMNGLNFELDRK